MKHAALLFVSMTYDISVRCELSTVDCQPISGNMPHFEPSKEHTLMLHLPQIHAKCNLPAHTASLYWEDASHQGQSA